MRRRILGLSLAGALLIPVAAPGQGAALNPAHPDRYVVQKGDTLWDIAGRFLREPWRWPEVWEANPQIRNPHLIYPGDEIELVYAGGEPRLRVRRGGPRPVVKLSPRVREEPLDRAIPTIPIDAIAQFLQRPRVVTDEELEAAPYVVSVGREALMARPGEKLFARGIEHGPGDGPRRYTLVRRGQPYVDPETGELLGIEAVHVADARLEVGGDPATLRITRMRREVLVGDRLLPVEEGEVDTHFLPRAPGRDVEGRIIAVVEGVSQIGQHQVVVLDLGARDGIDKGHVMAVYQRGETIVDPFAKRGGPETVGRRHLELDPERQGGAAGAAQAADDFVTNIGHRLGEFARRFNPRPDESQLVRLPDERAGTVMVFRPFERVSYALVMEAVRAMHVDDAVRSPETVAGR